MLYLKNVPSTLAAITLTATSTLAAPPIPTTPENEGPTFNDADINQDGYVDSLDVIEILMHWGDVSKPGLLAADVDGDGTVGFGDLLEVLAHYGA